jgi:quinolinate synthase
MEFSEQQQEVRRWLERRRGILLAHNYQPSEIQDVADFRDSLALSMTCQNPGRSHRLCGVHFMAKQPPSRARQDCLCPEDAGRYMAATPWQLRL